MQNDTSALLRIITSEEQCSLVGKHPIELDLKLGLATCQLGALGKLLHCCKPQFPYL